MVEVIQLHKDDVFIVNHLAEEIWPIAFKDILEKKQIDYMLDWMYNLNTLQEQVQTGILYYLIKKNGVAKGFLGVEPNHLMEIPIKEFNNLMKYIRLVLTRKT